MPNMTNVRRDGVKKVWVDGVELANCRVCGFAPRVEKMADGGLRIGCHAADPEPHKCVIESEPGTWAIQTWQALQVVGQDVPSVRDHVLKHGDVLGNPPEAFCGCTENGVPVLRRNCGLHK